MFELDRFLLAQEPMLEDALAELRSGQRARFRNKALPA